MWNDIQYALRSLIRRPLLTTVAVLSLALGIGVNTAMFSVFDRLLLRRLPVPAAEQIVNVTSPGPRPGSRSTGDGGRLDAIFSYPLFRDLERLEGDALQMAAHRDFRANLAYRGQTSDAEGLLVSGNYFPALRLRPALGRLLGPDDDRVQGAHPVVVLSHSYWTTRFGADPSVLGRPEYQSADAACRYVIDDSADSGAGSFQRSPRAFSNSGPAFTQSRLFQVIETLDRSSVPTSSAGV